MADRPRPSAERTLLWRLVAGAVALFVVLTVVGWVVGAVLSILRALVVIAGVAAIAWVVLVGVGRD